MRDNSTMHFLERLELDQMENDWTPPTEFPDLTNCKYIAIDLETKDPNLKKLGPGWVRKDGYVVGIAIAGGDFMGYYPIRHEAGGNLAEDRVMSWLKDQLNTPNIPKIMHNSMYDMGWLYASGVDVKGKIIDTMVAAPLVDENRFSYALNALGRDYIDMRKDEKLLRATASDWGIDAKEEMWRLPAKFVGAYAEQDVIMTLKLWDRLHTEITSQSLETVFDLETSLIPVVMDMRKKGVRVDLDQAEKARKKLIKIKDDLVLDIKKETSLEVLPWVATSIASVFDFYKVPYGRTESNNQPSFTKAFLQTCEHPIASKILKLREVDKANNTFIDSILRYEHKGRIHCEFHQLRSDDGGTVTGRFSSSNPNLQQIPARDPEI